MATRARRRRDDIQGLRAVGALLVAIFHIFVGRVSGGVDVFFVVSGYLMVGSLVREYRADGGIDVPAFAGRMALRLLPSAFFVVATILVSAPFWLPQVRWDNAMRHVAAAALYMENWYLAWSAVDYLARDQVASPLQHYWAMSVQVQSLLAISVLFGLVGMVLRRTRVDRRAASTAILSIIFASSLAYSVYATAHNQPLAYFNSFARLWEFAMGGLVAIAIPRLDIGEGTRLAGGWLGLSLILSCGILLKVSTIFPGYAALWPTGGAALVLICGEGQHRLGVGRLLEWRPLVWLGNISYALYLWHWPLLIAYLTLSYRTAAPFGPGVLILLASVMLAWATTHLIEAPFGRFKGVVPWRAIAASVAAVAAIVATDGAWAVYTRQAAVADRHVPHDPMRYPGAAAFDRPGSAAAAPVRPGPLWMKKDVSPLYARGCHQTITRDKPISCAIGDPAASHVLALVGGSHSAHWVVALEGAIKGTDWRLVTYTKSACLFRTLPPGTPSSDDPSCARWNANVKRELLQTRPDIVFTTATHGEAGSAERLTPANLARWRELTTAGIAVAAIRDNPWFRFDPPECVQVNGPTNPLCSMPRARAFAAVSPLAGAPPFAHLHYLDLTNRFCTPDHCPTVTGNVMMYSDRHHVTNSYMRTLTPYLAQQLRPVLAAEARSESIAVNARVSPALPAAARLKLVNPAKKRLTRRYPSDSTKPLK